jgi:molecular chaperone DnaK
VFSTAEDNQQAVTVHVLQGEREMARDNKSLGRFDLSDIPLAPRGIPQIEVTFDIDANGILHVGAKDKATGKENKIIIKASSGLSDEEVKRMIQEAELHAEEDKKMHELISARNHADSVIHSANKTLHELGDKVEADEKSKIVAAIDDLKKAITSDDKADIDTKTEALTDIAGKLAERLYAAQAAGAAEAAGAGHEAPSGSSESGKSGEDVVDAEFEEVKDDKK